MIAISETKKSYLEAYAKRYPTHPNWVDSEAKQTFEAVRLSDGSLLPIKKYSIKKDFCFGESGYDYDEACASAQTARTSQDYFKEANYQTAQKDIADLEDMDRIVIITTNDYGISDYVVCSEAYYLSHPWMFANERKATDEERKAILEAVNRCFDDFKKRIDAYLKRYGTSKVHAWTFWLDA